jgi:hypothetical protein
MAEEAPLSLKSNAVSLKTKPSAERSNLEVLSRLTEK